MPVFFINSNITFGCFFEQEYKNRRKQKKKGGLNLFIEENYNKYTRKFKIKIINERARAFA